MLPDKLGKSVTESFEHAENSISLLAEANNQAQIVSDSSTAFRPLHEQVRDIRIATLSIDSEIEETETLLDRLDDDSPDREKLIVEIEALNSEREAQEATTPANWDTARNDFTELQLAERKQRTEYLSLIHI